jgi:hypothetical protein
LEAAASFNPFNSIKNNRHETGNADLKHGKSSSGIVALLAGENHRFLFAANIMNLGLDFRLEI